VDQGRQHEVVDHVPGEVIVKRPADRTGAGSVRYAGRVASGVS
jgi:hypothetical protein